MMMMILGNSGEIEEGGCVWCVKIEEDDKCFINKIREVQIWDLRDRDEHKKLRCERDKERDKLW